MDHGLWTMDHGLWTMDYGICIYSHTYCQVLELRGDYISVRPSVCVCRGTLKHSILARLSNISKNDPCENHYLSEVVVKNPSLKTLAFC